MTSNRNHLLSSLVGVAKRTPHRIHVILHPGVRGKPKHWHRIIQRRRNAIVPLPLVRKGPVVRVLLLPLPPNPINHGVVKEEDRVCHQ